jgi:hypothetical protein
MNSPPEGADVAYSSGKPNAQYNVAAPDSMALRATAMMRRRMYERFIAATAPSVNDTLLDVGVTSDRSYESSNYLEAWYPHKQRITACGIDDASFLEEMYPGVCFKQANGLSLPFDDASFDVVHSSAVIEHVGSRANQARFIAELHRVARRAVCLTTPNRWFPVEVHTSVPLLHWLPAGAYRAILRTTQLRFFADEANLNLLSAGDLRKICRRLAITGASVEGVRLLGWTSNLLLFVDKTTGSGRAGG